MFELIYTSAPRGLLPGRSGFSTVAMTKGMPPNLIVPLENLSGYNFTYHNGLLPDELNPICCYYIKLRYGNCLYPIAGRVAPNGLDYTRRNNKIAHHILLEDTAEIKSFCGGAADCFLPSGNMFVQHFDQEPYELPYRIIPEGTPPVTLQSNTWARLAGDAGAAALLARKFQQDKKSVFYVVYPAGTAVEDLLNMAAEICRLLDDQIEKSDFTFSTYFQEDSASSECFLRFIPDFSPLLNNLRRFHGNILIELDGKFQLPAEWEDDPLCQLARSGGFWQEEEEEAIMLDAPEITDTAAAAVPPKPLYIPESQQKMRLRMKKSSDTAADGNQQPDKPESDGGSAVLLSCEYTNSRSKLIFMGLAGLVVLLILGVILYFFSIPDTIEPTPSGKTPPSSVKIPAATDPKVEKTTQPKPTTVPAGKTGGNAAAVKVSRQPPVQTATQSKQVPAAQKKQSAPSRTADKGSIAIADNGQLRYTPPESIKNQLDKFDIRIGKLGMGDFNSLSLYTANWNKLTDEWISINKNVANLQKKLEKQKVTDEKCKFSEVQQQYQELLERADDIDDVEDAEEALRIFKNNITTFMESLFTTASSTGDDSSIMKKILQKFPDDILEEVDDSKDYLKVAAQNWRRRKEELRNFHNLKKNWEDARKRLDKQNNALGNCQQKMLHTAERIAPELKSVIISLTPLSPPKKINSDGIKTIIGKMAEYITIKNVENVSK